MSTKIDRTTPETKAWIKEFMRKQEVPTLEQVVGKIMELERQRDEARELARELRDALDDLLQWAKNWDSPFLDDDQFVEEEYTEPLAKAKKLLP